MNKKLLGYVVSDNPNFGDWTYPYQNEMYMAKVTVFENRKTGRIMSSKPIFEPLDKMATLTYEDAIYYMESKYYGKEVVDFDDANDLMEAVGIVNELVPA